MPTPVEQLEKIRKDLDSAFRSLDARAERIRRLKVQFRKAIYELPQSRERNRLVALLRELAKILDEMVLDDDIQWL